MSTTITAPPVRQRRTLYVGISALMASIAITGFWPKYFGPLVFGTLVQPILIHVHAIVFTGWLMLFLIQAALAATHRVRWHLRLGTLGIWYGVLLIVVGLTTGVMRSAEHQLDGGGERLLFQAVADMMMFGGFFGAALVYRRKPQLHRRLMVVAATSLLIAAVGRMTFLPAPPAGLGIRLVVWSMPVLIAMAYEFKQSRALHPIYLLGLAVFVARRLSVPLSQTTAWGSFAHWVWGHLA